MSPLPAVLIGLAVAHLLSRSFTVVMAGTAVVLLHPAAGLAGSAAVGVVRLYRWLRRQRVRAERAAADVAVLAELVGLALSAGLTLTGALMAARPHIDPVLAAEVDDLLRRAASGGLARALAASEGHGRRLYVVVARAVVTGAPLAPAVDGFVREVAAGQRAARLEHARRLPVRLLVPLALLILPGFVLLTVGPTVLAALERFVLPH